MVLVSTRVGGPSAGGTVPATVVSVVSVLGTSLEDGVGSVRGVKPVDGGVAIWSAVPDDPHADAVPKSRSTATPADTTRARGLRRGSGTIGKTVLRRNRSP